LTLFRQSAILDHFNIITNAANKKLSKESSYLFSLLYVFFFSSLFFISFFILFFSFFPYLIIYHLLKVGKMIIASQFESCTVSTVFNFWLAIFGGP